MTKIERIIKEWTSKVNALRCKDVVTVLEDLGFTVRETGNGGHRVFDHGGLPSFAGSNFDGGHGANAEVKACYIRNILKVMRNYKDELDDSDSDDQSTID
ncbi:type II toxin-antitoxin system HicA family toxin [Achromobacter mucicolens]|uniref:type II toxin-antitoxin system HicA family toxin n=1 Tax=Achromobacter mucicolens TaxID=1389922 RepID=UPI00320B06DA